MQNLFDVIDEEIAERMLEQHDRYEFGDRIAVQRAKNPDGTHKGWFVYYGPPEVHCLENPGSEPRSFFKLADALDCALSPANQERWGEAWSRKYVP